MEALTTETTIVWLATFTGEEMKVAAHLARLALWGAFYAHATNAAIVTNAKHDTLKRRSKGLLWMSSAAFFCTLLVGFLAGLHFDETLLNNIREEAIAANWHEHNTWSFIRIFLHLKNIQGKTWSHKRAHKRLGRNKPQPPAALPNSIMQPIDLMRNNLSNGCSYRIFKLSDNLHRQLLAPPDVTPLEGNGPVNHDISSMTSSGITYIRSKAGLLLSTI